MRLKGGAKRCVELYDDGYKFHVKRDKYESRFNRAFMVKGEHVIRVRYRHAVKASRFIQLRGAA